MTSRRGKRNRLIWAISFLLLLTLIALHLTSAHGHTHAAIPPPRRPTGHHSAPTPRPQLNLDDPDWNGDGEPVTFAFAGDVHFPAGTNLGDRLAADPETALGPTVP